MLCALICLSVRADPLVAAAARHAQVRSRQVVRYRDVHAALAGNRTLTSRLDPAQQNRRQAGSRSVLARVFASPGRPLQVDSNHKVLQ